MKLLTKPLLLFENFIVFSIFLGLLAIATLSLVSLSPISLEDYSTYLATNQQIQQPGTVAGVFDDPSNYGVRIENLLEGQDGYTYDLVELDKRHDLNLSASFNSSAPTEVDLLAITNKSERQVAYQIDFKFTGPAKTKNALVAGPYLTALEAAPQTYQLSLPAGERVVLRLVRDVNNSYDWYELRKEYQLQLTITSQASQQLTSLP